MFQSGDEVDGYDHNRITVSMQVGKLQKAMLNKMESIKNIMRVSGWFDKSPDGPPDYESLEHIEPSNHVGPGEWETWISEKKDEALQEHMSGYGVDGPQGSSRTLRSNTNVVNNVKIVNKSYFEKSYDSGHLYNEEHTETTIKEFELNDAQERAFRIVANHATLATTNQLKMYLGGMGGTGKLRVIKALVSFFKMRNEGHKILILAPTGSAAALLTGYTYHSALGINDNFNYGGTKGVAQVNDKFHNFLPFLSIQ